MPEIKKILSNWGAASEKSKVRRLKILSHIPWDPKAFPDRRSVEWLRNLDTQYVYYYKYGDQEAQTIVKFSLSATIGLLSLDPGSFTLPSGKMQQIRVLKWDIHKRSFQECNPKILAPESCTYWLFNDKKIQHLVWDLGEWQWVGIGNLKAEPFFTYTVKWGYIQGLKDKEEESLAIHNLKS